MSIPGGATHPFFGPAAELGPAEGIRVAAALAAIASPERRAPPAGSPAAALRWRVVDVASRFPSPADSDRCGSAWSLGRTVALDAAADLLEIADRMHAAGHVVEAFALEGIEARILEALVSSGA
jgi:hypothetical protein